MYSRTNSFKYSYFIRIIDEWNSLPNDIKETVGVSSFKHKVMSFLKVLANEDTLLRTHCCRHKCFPVCPRAQHLLRTQILCPGHKNVSDFVQKHFVSATNVSQFARASKSHEQQCVRNNVSSFASTFSNTYT